MKQNADSYKQKKQDYYLRNKENVSAYHKEYRRKNAEKCKQADRDKYARILSASENSRKSNRYWPDMP